VRHLPLHKQGTSNVVLTFWWRHPEDEEPLLAIRDKMEGEDNGSEVDIPQPQCGSPLAIGLARFNNAQYTYIVATVMTALESLKYISHMALPSTPTPLASTLNGQWCFKRSTERISYTIWDQGRKEMCDRCPSNQVSMGMWEGGECCPELSEMLGLPPQSGCGAARHFDARWGITCCNSLMHDHGSPCAKQSRNVI
jgi:hypothetical protein